MPQPSASHTPLTYLRCTLDYPSLDEFVAGYGRNLSNAAVFLPMREPLDVGSGVRFELVLADSQIALRGEGTVSVRAPYEPGAPERLHGVGLRISKLDAASRGVLERVVAYKVTHPGEFFEPARDPILSPLSPFAFVAPSEAPSGKPAVATVASVATQKPATVTTDAPATQKPAIATTEAAATQKPAMGTADVAALSKPVASRVEPVAAQKPATVTLDVPLAAKPTAASVEPTAAQKPATAAVAPAVAQPATAAREPAASQRTPLRPLTIPRATLPSKGTPKPSAQTPLVALNQTSSDKTPVPSGGSVAQSAQTPKLRPTDSAQTPRVELPVPAAASGPRRVVSDSTKTPSPSAMTPVVTLDAALKEPTRGQPAPGPSPSGRSSGRSSPDERSRHDADQELAALRTPASARSAPPPDAAKRLQELLTRRPSGGKD